MPSEDSVFKQLLKVLKETPSEKGVAAVMSVLNGLYAQGVERLEADDEEKRPIPEMEVVVDVQKRITKMLEEEPSIDGVKSVLKMLEKRLTEFKTARQQAIEAQNRVLEAAKRRAREDIERRTAEAVANYQKRKEEEGRGGRRRRYSSKRFGRCVKSVRKTVKAREGSTPEGAAIAICTKTLLFPAGRTIKRYKKGRLTTQKRRR